MSKLQEAINSYKNMSADEIVYVNSAFITIMEKQDELNKEMTGNPNYAIELITKHGKSINYGDCLISEINELQDSFPWKHWKDSTLNFDNVNTELIDIFHFAPSVVLTIITEYPTVRVPIMISGFSIVDSSILNKYKIDDTNGYTIIKNNMMEAATKISNFYVEETLGSSESRIALMPYAYDLMTDALIMYMMHNDIATPTEAIDSIYAKYIIKNVLNSFRMSNGYREGTYIKMWNGVEDNDVAYGIVKNYTGDLDNLENALVESLNSQYALIAKDVEC